MRKAENTPGISTSFRWRASPVEGANSTQEFSYVGPSSVGCSRGTEGCFHNRGLIANFYRPIRSLDLEKSGGPFGSTQPSISICATKAIDRFRNGPFPFFLANPSRRSLHPWQAELDLLSAGKKRSCFRNQARSRPSTPYHAGRRSI